MQIKNTTSKSVSLKGWTLTDTSRHKYTFGTYTLGKGKNTTANRYQDRGARVRNTGVRMAGRLSAKGSVGLQRCDLRHGL